jgi:hypothetical protein
VLSCTPRLEDASVGHLVQNRTDTERPTWHDRPTPPAMCPRRGPMLLILAVFVTVIVVVVISRLRVPGGVDAADLGSVSDRWLAEHRGSHPS